MGGRDDEPLGDDEFEARLDGCLGLHRRAAGHVVLGVSGGSDSTALMQLAAALKARRDGAAPDFSVVTVDHGLRPASAAEATAVADAARRLGLAHATLVWSEPRPVTGIQAAARAARIRLIGDHMRARELRYLALAHTEDDQAETLLMRLARGSGIDGLAAMQPMSIIAGIAVIRPLLGVAKRRLVATLRERGVAWIEDPSNACETFERVRLRRAAPALAAVALTSRHLARSARRLARAGAALDQVVSTTVERSPACVRIDPLGFADLDWRWLMRQPEEVRIRILRRLIGSIGASGWPAVSLGKLEALTEARDWAPPVGRTLSGCMFRPARDGHVQLVREPGRHGLPRIDPIPGRGMDWDNRFTIRLAVGVTAPLLVAALGPEGLALLDGLGQQRPPVPASVLRALPGLWRGRTLIAVPMLGYFSDDIDPAHVDCGFSARPFPECSPGSS